MSLTSRWSRFPTMKQETKCKSENIRGKFRAQGLRSQLTILPPTKTAPVVCFLVLNVSLFADNTLADALRLRKMRSIEKNKKGSHSGKLRCNNQGAQVSLLLKHVPKRVSLTQSVALGQARNRHVLLLNELPAPFKKSKAWGFANGASLRGLDANWDIGVQSLCFFVVHLDQRKQKYKMHACASSLVWTYPVYNLPI